ncbi:CRISPR-associated protein Cas4 [Pikeienuella piscinae]|uniref:CRISPR-associated exonuclease Cas4 n=1 Tax=Pikeienuella piscinae TaxID=2748098 RepID=A0A7L5C408_9RHOB|nr:CRISPR-associated protein Cas4 [Pikeienuella piscinae]QIE56659.1 CRISPR-associated protein Cas4 [Pikeienuella piscinae]
MSGSERLSLPISALQHWLFCPRQCALIHVERLWAENRLTAEGRILHERADGGASDRHGGALILRAVELLSETYGLHGVADIVELHHVGPFPVEYKRGRPKAHRADEVQLCAQALCLEEAFGRPVLEGALFYGERRRRTPVAIDESLRQLTVSVIEEARAVLSAGRVPAPVFEAARCRACSLKPLCRPERLSAPPAVDGWLRRAVARAGAPE